MNNEIADEWTVVVDKRTKKANMALLHPEKFTPKTRVDRHQAKIHRKSKEEEEYKINRGIPLEFRPIRKRDYTLTPSEKLYLAKKQISGCCCECCSSDEVAKAIRRPFTGCRVCYCCAGDDPSVDSPDLCVYVNEQLNESYIFWDKNCRYKYRY